MNSKLLIIILSACWLCACRREDIRGTNNADSIPTNSFQLSLKEGLADADNKIWLCDISARPDSCFSVDGEDFHSQFALPDSGDPVSQHAGVFMSATRIAPGQSSLAYIQILMRPMTKEHLAGGAGVLAVPTNTSLTEFISIYETNGVFKLDSPIIIGQMQGKPLTLVVGKPTKAWSDKSPTAVAPFDLHKP